ncbi:MAG: dockerin type I repeat-containing protein, partial [Oscillospiraceae bacterium]|nr:dockerin type I repeat-containing protein [Oscillospiraceae bacterium]
EPVTQPTTTTTTEPVTDPTTTTSIAIQDRLYGDIDGNGVVEMTDLTTLSQYLIHDIKLTDEQMILADVTGDNEVGLADLSHLKQYIMHEDNIVLGPQK